MNYVITDSSIDTTNLFKINGLEYEKSIYVVEYGSYEDNQGTPENIYISLINKYNRKSITSSSLLSKFSDGVNPLSVGDIASIITREIVLKLYDYIIRVNQEGGTIEAIENLNNKLSDMGANVSEDLYGSVFKIRLSDDSAVYESLDNLYNKLEDIGFSVVR